MTNTDTRAARPGRPRTNSRPIKTPRCDLVLLEVEADDCPQVLLRVLGLVSRDGSIPVTINASRTDAGITAAIELDGASSVASDRIATRVVQIPTVREVRLAGRRLA